MANHLPADLKTLDRAWGFIISSALLSIIVGSNLSQATPEGDALHIIKEVLHAEVNWTGNDPCQAWEGVRCSLNHVIGLNISMKRLHGTLPAQVGQLSFLESLDISHNHVEGNIPIEIANLTSLHTLILRFNLFSGGFPLVILKLKKMVILRLDNNEHFSGPLPSGIGKLSSLESLFLGNCSFTGRIPVEMGNLINLTKLSIWGNVLNSTIPVELSKLTNLEYLYVDPHYFLRKHLTLSSDVYSYGVVLLVLITGQKVIDHDRVEEVNLIEWVNLKFQKDDLESIIDSHLLLREKIPPGFRTVTELALKCAAYERSERPSMSKAVQILETVLKNETTYERRKTNLGIDETFASSSSTTQRSFVEQDTILTGR